MVQKIKKIFFCISIITYFVIFFCYPASALTCEVIHVNFTGKCVANDEQCPADKPAIDNSRNDLCLPNEKCCYKRVADTGTDLQPVSEDNIQLQIPLFDFSQASNIAQYIAKLYEYLLIILVPLTIIMIIKGGIEWIAAAGNNTKIAGAKKQITGSFIGLGIAIFSYIFLSLVGITTFNLPQLQKIDPETGGDILVIVEPNFIVGAGTPSNLNCSETGGSAAIAALANGAMGKITYRMGGKPWKQNPPFTADNKNCGTQKCRDFCPSGQLCLDCSGYMSWLYMCVGLKSPPSFTGDIFKSCTHINSYTATSANGIELKPGDLVGYPPSGCGQSIGHVLIYIGNGIISESHGGGGTENANSGREPGNAIINSKFETWAKKHSPCGCVKRVE